jgi:anti-anti-sigma factor
MSIKLEEYDRVCIMTPSGDLAGSDALAARRQAQAVRERKRVATWVVDCEKVGFIDSEGLETLLWIKRNDGASSQMKLANVDENCQKILQVTRLAHYFEYQPNLAAALKTLRQ